MAYAIIRGKSGRRHEVDFGSSPLRVEVHASEETIEIYIEAIYAKKTCQLGTGRRAAPEGVACRTVR